MTSLRCILRLLFGTLLSFCLVYLFAAPTAAAAQSAKERVSGRWVSHSNGPTLMVFVHGLTGGPATWRNDKSPEWPEIVARDSLFKSADVYVAEYSSSYFGAGQTPPKIAQALTNKLRADDVNIAQYQNVVFVAHSLGGIVVREFVLADANKDIRSKIKALFLFAVPGEGSEIANWAGLLPASETVLSLQQKKLYGSYLDDLSKRWTDAGLKSISSYCAYESLGVPIGPVNLIVVSPRSAGELCNARLQKIEANHLNIVKPRGAGDVRHLWLRNWYRKEFPNSTISELVERNASVLLTTCGVDRYGRDFQAAITNETYLTGFSIRISQELPQTWHPRDVRFLWDKYPPKIIVIHLSCFQSGVEENSPRVIDERDRNFLQFLRSLERYNVKILVYSRAFASVPTHLDTHRIVQTLQSSGRLKKLPIFSVWAFSSDLKQRVAYRKTLAAMLSH